MRSSPRDVRPKPRGWQVLGNHGHAPRAQLPHGAYKEPMRWCTASEVAEIQQRRSTSIHYIVTTCTRQYGTTPARNPLPNRLMRTKPASGIRTAPIYIRCRRRRRDHSAWTGYVASSSRTRTLARCRRRTTRATASVRSVKVRPKRTPSTASHTSSGVSPSSNCEAWSSLGELPGLNARNPARSSRVPLRPCRRHSSRTPISP